MPTFGSLFAGIGGLDLGLERAGWECRWQVEIDPFCRAVLAKHWPDVPRFGDVRELTGQELESVDLIAGGFPCQPVSHAGRRLGAEDERWLWPEFERVLRLLRPQLVLVENVPGLLVRGMGDVLGGLAALGYDAEWQGIPAAVVGAPHLRDRVWVVAHQQGDTSRPDPDGQRSHRASVYEYGRAEQGRVQPRDEQEREPRSVGEVVADAQGISGELRQASSERPRRSPGSGDVADADSRRRDGGAWIFGEGWRPEPSDGDWWAVEPDVGRVAHGVPSRVDRLRALGNAVVPQVAEWIGRRLMRETI